jgi:3-hydroxybutyryl-CoA dehydrogenase
VLDGPGPWRLPDGGRVAVLGGGLMGHALVGVFLAGGFDVVCVETDGSTRASLRERVVRVIDQLPDRGAEHGRLNVVGAVTDLDSTIGLVVEAVPENLGLKRELFARVAAICPTAVLATNSSVYRVGDVGGLVPDGSHVIGTHWWNPPHLVPLVEVIEGERTDSRVVEGMIDLLATLGKTPVHVKKDTPGFIGNRLQHALWREAMDLVQEGVCEPHDIDLVVRNSIGLRLSVVGPMENADYVGLDLTHAIHEYVFPALSVANAPLAILEAAVEAGDLGAKTGRGFFEWPEGARESLGRKIAERVELLVSLIEPGNSTD